MLFNYEQCNEISSFQKNIIERIIRDYVHAFFHSCTFLFKEFRFLPSKCFSTGVDAIANPNEGVIDFKINIFLECLPKLQRGDVSAIELGCHPLFNTIHHECCHIENALILESAYNAIESTETYVYVKEGIKKLLDEYIASYKAQRIYFRKSNAIERISALIHEPIPKTNHWYCMFFDIVETLAFALSENQALLESKCIAPLEAIMSDMPARPSHLFTMIHHAILQYSDKSIDSFIDMCRIAMIELLEILNADFGLLKQIDNKYDGK